MFYPALKRRDNYQKKADGNFYRYAYYRDAIQEDCQNRCVYCDVMLQEHAYEGMHLDHFRPQHYFKNLANDPNNLVLACPNCNALKTNHWPCDRVNPVSPCHNNNVGFIDPFSDKMSYYFFVNSDGTLVPMRKPADYIIELLKLNRQARVLLRKRRLQLALASNFHKVLSTQLDRLIDALIEQKIDKKTAQEKRQKIISAMEIVQQLINPH